MSQQQLRDTIGKAYTASRQVEEGHSSLLDAIVDFVGDQQEAWRQPKGFNVTLPSGEQQGISQYMKNHKLQGAKCSIPAETYLLEQNVTAWHALRYPYRELMFDSSIKDDALDKKLSKYAGYATTQMALSRHMLGPRSAKSLFDELKACNKGKYVLNTWLEELRPLVEEQFSAVFQACKIKGKHTHRMFALKLRHVPPAINLLPTAASAVHKFSRLSERNRNSKNLEAIVSDLCKGKASLAPAGAAAGGGAGAAGGGAAAGAAAGGLRPQTSHGAAAAAAPAATGIDQEADGADHIAVDDGVQNMDTAKQVEYPVVTGQLVCTQQQAAAGDQDLDTSAAAATGVVISAASETQGHQLRSRQQPATCAQDACKPAATADSPMAAGDVAEGQQEASQQQQATLGGRGIGTHAATAADSPMAAVDVAEGQQEASQQQQAAVGGHVMGSHAAAGSSGAGASHSIALPSRTAQALYPDAVDVPVAHDADCNICLREHMDLLPFGCGDPRHSLCRECKQRCGQTCPYCRREQEPGQVAEVEGQRDAGRRGVLRRRELSPESDQEETNNRRRRRRQTGGRQQQRRQQQQQQQPEGHEEVLLDADSEDYEYDAIAIYADACLEDLHDWIHRRIDDRNDVERVYEVIRRNLHTRSPRHPDRVQP